LTTRIGGTPVGIFYAILSLIYCFALLEEMEVETMVLSDDGQTARTTVKKRQPPKGL
jgi:hypothetical protein